MCAPGNFGEMLGLCDWSKLLLTVGFNSWKVTRRQWVGGGLLMSDSFFGWRE